MSNSKSQQHDEALARYARVQARYWSDEGFKGQIQENPEAALKDYGVGVDRGVSLNLVVNDNNTVHLVIPARPESMTNENVEVLLAAGTFGTGGSVGTAGTACGCAGTFGTLFTFGCADL